MILKRPELNVTASNAGKSRLEETISQLHADLVLDARMWAADEISAAMVHQLNEPLTALLLYLHGIKQQSGVSLNTESIPMRQMVESAIRETQRFSDIVQRMGRTFEKKTASGVEAAQIHESIVLSSGKIAQDTLALGQQLLTPRERQVLSLITEGNSNKEGGHRLQISTRTFEVHRAHIMGKLGARNAADLVRMTLREGK